MRLRVLNPNTDRRITALIAQQAAYAASEHSAVSATEPTWGTPSIETAVDVHLAAVALLDLVGGIPDADGFLVAAYSDPGLDALREVLDVPVVGIGEASVEHAAAIGDFAVLTIAPTSLGLVEAAVRRHDVGGRCRAVVCLDLSVADAAEPDRVAAQLDAAADRLLAEHELGAIVLGGGPLGVHAGRLSARLGIPVVDPVAAGIRELERRVVSQPTGHRRLQPGALRAKHLSGDQPFLPRIEALLQPPVLPAPAVTAS